MDHPRFLPLAAVSLLSTVLLVSGGCDNTITPFSERGAYSIYGYLSLSRSQQLIRVKKLDVPLSKVDSNSINATVTLENVTDGTSEVLRDSIITYEDDKSTVLTHNFLTETPVAPESKYRITIEGADGKSVEATTTTPTDVDATVQPAHGSCRARFEAIFNRVSDLRNVRAWVEVKLEEHPQREPWVSIRRRDLFKHESRGDVAVDFSPASVLNYIDERLEDQHLNGPPLPDSLSPFCWRTSICSLLDTNEIRVRYLYLGPEWYGSVPEDSISYDPLASNDVKNGLGFFGSARRDVQTTLVDTTAFIYSGGPLCSQPPPDST